MLKVERLGNPLEGATSLQLMKEQEEKQEQAPDAPPERAVDVPRVSDTGNFSAVCRSINIGSNLYLLFSLFFFFCSLGYCTR